MSRCIAFGEFEADLTSGELRRNGTPVPLQDLPFRLLAALIERPGDVVTRTELAGRLWGNETYVDATAGLNTAIAKLREALGDDPDAPQFVETIPKRGYRFVGTIREVESSSTAAAPTTDQPVSRRWRAVAAVASVIGVIGVAAAATYQLRATPEPVRIAVVLFDNETGDDRLAPLSQGLTDAVVTTLTAESRLAVIGNAAVLRTPRPFRDIAKVRDALDAGFIVIGQLQQLDGATIVRAHLIRARDQAHVWVKVIPRGGANETDFQAAVAEQVLAAVSAHALAR